MALETGYLRKEFMCKAFAFASDTSFKQKSNGLDASLGTKQTSASKVLGRKATSVAVTNTSASVSSTAKTAKTNVKKSDANVQDSKNKQNLFVENLKKAQKDLSGVVEQAAENTGQDKGAAIDAFVPVVGDSDFLRGAGLMASAGVLEFATALIEAVCDVKRERGMAKLDPQAIIQEMKALLTPKRDVEGQVVAPAAIQSDFDFENGFDWDSPKLLDEMRDFMKPAHLHMEYCQLDNSIVNSKKTHDDATAVEANKYNESFDILAELALEGDGAAKEIVQRDYQLSDEFRSAAEVCMAAEFLPTVRGVKLSLGQDLPTSKSAMDMIREACRVDRGAVCLAKAPLVDDGGEHDRGLVSLKKKPLVSA